MHFVQVPPQLSGADELLDIPLDEDCLQRLLSNDLAEDSCTKLKVRCSPRSPRCPACTAKTDSSTQTHGQVPMGHAGLRPDSALSVLMTTCSSCMRRAAMTLCCWVMGRKAAVSMQAMDMAPSDSAKADGSAVSANTGADPLQARVLHALAVLDMIRVD